MFLAPGLERAFQEPLGLGPVGGIEDGAHPGGLQAGVIVGDDELNPFQPSGQEAFQKAPPVDFRFRGGDLATEDATLARGLDADGQ